jgi:hypothetical protein
MASKYAGLLKKTYADTNAVADWAQGPLAEVIAMGVIPSKMQSLYSAYTTRAEFAALVIPVVEKYLGTVDITGVTAPDTADKNILKCKVLGIMSGDKINDTYYMNPNSILTRVQAAGFIANTAQVLGCEDKSGDLGAFTDASSISSWAQELVKYVVGWGLMNGDGQSFNPNKIYSRLESVLAVRNLVNTYNNKQ